MKQEDNNNIITYRLEQAQTALDDAIYLSAGGRSPQSIVNRCYYAMFYATLALLQDIGKAPTKHSGIISLFDTEYVIKGISPASCLKIFTRLLSCASRQTTRSDLLCKKNRQKKKSARHHVLSKQLRATFNHLDTTPVFWLNLQKNFDLWQAEHTSNEWQSVQPFSPRMLHSH